MGASQSSLQLPESPSLACKDLNISSAIFGGQARAESQSAAPFSLSQTCTTTTRKNPMDLMSFEEEVQYPEDLHMPLVFNDEHYARFEESRQAEVDSAPTRGHGSR